MEGIINSFLGWLSDMISNLINLLPNSPFQISVPNNVLTILGYVNYFIPISEMLATLTIWTGCIAMYFVSSLLLRWIKAID